MSQYYFKKRYNTTYNTFQNDPTLKERFQKRVPLVDGAL